MMLMFSCDICAGNLIEAPIFFLECCGWMGRDKAAWLELLFLAVLSVCY